MAELAVAAAQFELRSEPGVDAYVNHVDDLIGQGAAGGAELIVLPELSSTGLLGAVTSHQVTADTIASDYRNILTGWTDAIVEGVVASAKKHGVVVLGGSHNRLEDDGILRNTAYLVHPDGRIETQDKIHLTPQEHALGAQGGDRLVVTRVGPFTVGVLICADIQFPELSRYLTRQGVDLILCPSLTWNRRGVHRVRTGCEARAMENQLFVVMSPLVGCSGLPADAPMHATGRAIVTAPVDRTFGLNDGILAADEDSIGEKLVFATLDRDLLERSRRSPESPGLKLQRPDLYASLTRHHGQQPTAHT